jgi:hypothetical protein
MTVSRKPPHIKLYVKDFAFDTQDMTDKELGKYMREFLLAYKTGIFSEKHQENTLFFELKSSFLSYSRQCETNKQNRTKSNAYADESSTNGQRMVDEPVNHEPITNNHEPITNKDISPLYSLFDEFWNLYPRQRRGRKEKVLKAWIKANDRASSGEIMQGLMRYAQSDDVERGYAKGAEAWLNDDRWNYQYDIRPTNNTNNRNNEPSAAFRAIASLLSEEGS